MGSSPEGEFLEKNEPGTCTGSLFDDVTLSLLGCRPPQLTSKTVNEYASFLSKHLALSMLLQPWTVDQYTKEEDQRGNDQLLRGQAIVGCELADRLSSPWWFQQETFWKSKGAKRPAGSEENQT